MRTRTITTIMLTGALLLPAGGVATAQASTLTTSGAVMVDTIATVHVPQKARKRCKKKQTKRFNRAMHPFSFKIRCGYRFKKKNWRDPAKARFIIRAKKIILPCYRGGWERGNRRGTVVRITRPQDGLTVRWKGYEENWTGLAEWEWTEGGWKFYDLRGSKTGRVYGGIC